jgi:tryptophanyl-tRNA synthetase
MIKKPEQHVIVSGIKPSGRLHVANYAGAVRDWLRLQNSNKCWFFIADYHQMAEAFDPATNREKVLDLALDLLALGLDPKKCTLFVQSDVPEHTELAWIFNSVTPIAFLERMTQYKDKSLRQKENINAALLEYPVLMAADILIYKSDRVPVGRDQIQHVELTRDIARFFNNKFGLTFPETVPILTDTPKLRSLTDPLKKMSKSLGERSFISLTDSPDEIYLKLKSAVTESTGILKLSEEELEHRLSLHEEAHADEAELRGMAGVWNLITMLKLFGKPGEADRVIAAQPIKYGDLKKLVASRVAKHFEEFRSKRAKLAKSPAKVWKVLAEGGRRARAAAKKTMVEIRKKIGIR